MAAAATHDFDHETGICRRCGDASLAVARDPAGRHCFPAQVVSLNARRLIRMERDRVRHAALARAAAKSEA